MRDSLPVRGEEVTMLVARPPTVSGVFALFAPAQKWPRQTRNAETDGDKIIPAIRQASGLTLSRIPVLADDIAQSAEPAASTG